MSGDHDVGNPAQVRIIATQLFEVWKEDQGRQRASWPAWGGLVLSLIGVVFVAGSLTQDVATANDRSSKNERRIEVLERDRAALARIEAKVDVLMEERAK